MSDDKLKLVETCALLTLLDEGREVPNTYLTKEAGLKLERPQREHLVDLGLLDVRTENRRLLLSLSDKGWRRALEVIGGEAPAGSGYRGATIHRLARRIGRHLERTGEAPSEFFAGHDEVAGDGQPAAVRAAPRPGDVIELVRKAYHDLAGTPGEPVTLAELRDRLAGLERARVDEALVALSSTDGVTIFPESNQKTLTPEERAASVTIGNQDKHLITIGS